MPVDTAPNNMSRARRLNVGPTNTVVNEWVGASDPNDHYRINLANRSRLIVNLRAAGNGARVQLIKDLNGNGRLDAGEVLGQKRSLNNVAKQFAREIDAGTYFLRVVRTGGNANYSLTTKANNLSTSTGGNSFINEVVSLTNQYRQQNGLQPLTFNSRLGTAAQNHSQNMALQDFFNHTGLDGSEAWDRVSATGYQWSRVGENIAAGQRTAQDVVQGWINSTGHRANILNPNFTEIGVGYYLLSNDTGNVNYNSYWTQVFARPM